MNKLKLKNLDVFGKKILMRVDFNVPFDASNQILDDTRIKATLPSIEYVLKNGGKLILMSHLGKPNGKKDSKYSLLPCAKRLSELLKQEVFFCPDCIGKEAEKMVQDLKNGQVLLLENLRFYDAEEHPDKDPSFEKALARLGDYYVNDAFGAAHRAHASTALVAKYFPHQAACGFLIEKEIASLSILLDHPDRPYFALIGGAKISTKLGVLKSLLKKVDRLFIGGGMSFTFLKALGFSTGSSLLELAMEEEAKNLISKVELPLDLVIASSIAQEAEIKTIPFPSHIPDGWSGVDIGEKTIEKWKKEFNFAKSFFWNGPVGIFEIEAFSNGTHKIAQILANSKAKVIVGGGDSVAAVEKMGLGKGFYHLSTGGGASLEWLEFGHLPGIDALSNE